MSPKYSGADWLEPALRHRGKTMSAFGRRVADVLGAVFLGIYHIEAQVLRADWSSEHHIEIRLGASLATYDYNHLTALVVLAHDACLRVEISPCNPRVLRLMFHPRRREGRLSERHPTIEAAAALIRECLLDLREAEPLAQPQVG